MAWLVWLGIAGPAWGAVRFDVFVGYDAILPAGAWFPVVCEVENSGPSFDGIFEIRSGNFSQSDVRRLELELPTGTLKRFVVPMHASSLYTRSFDARLVDRRGKVRAEALNLAIRQENQDQLPLVGALSRLPPVFPEVKARNINPPLVARLLPPLFPDHPVALQGLDVIYLNSERALDLRESQVMALQAWLYGGGHLVLGIEQSTHLQGLDWLEKILPCTVAGSQTVSDHLALQQWLVSDPNTQGQPMRSRLWLQGQGQPAPDAVWRQVYGGLAQDEAFEAKPLEVTSAVPRDGQVLAGTTGQPLMLGANRGLGRVTVLTFSPELEPFLSWTNRTRFWAKLCDMPPELFAGPDSVQPVYRGQSLDAVFGAMIETRQVRKLPVGWLLLLLVAYLIVIGPLDRLWLKKINRPMLTWLTFPAYVAFFSILIYFIGYKLRAGETEWNELHLVDVLQTAQGGWWQGRTFGALYSPANASYPFRSDESIATLRSEFGAQDMGRSLIDQHDNSFAGQVWVSVWTSRLLVSDWWREGEAPWRVTLDEGGRTLSVASQASQEASHLALAWNGVIYTLSSLPAGQTRTFNLAECAQRPINAFVSDHSGSFQGAAQARRQAFGGSGYSQIGNLTNATLAACFLSQGNEHGFLSPPGLDLSPVLERGEAVLLAWTQDQSPIAPLNQFKPRRQHRDTLWRLRIPASEPRAP